MVGGEPYTGKTMLTLAMALALDAGKPLLGFEPQERRKVLYIGQDAPTWDYAEQSRKLLMGYELTPQQVDALNTDVCFNQGHDLLDKTFWNFLRDWHAEVGFDVVVFDTLAAMHSADENSNREMNIIMNTLKRIRDALGVTVIFTHHESKPSDSGRSAVYKARGASVISGSVDIYLSLQAMVTGQVRLTMPKGRGIANNKRRVLYTMQDVGSASNPGIQLIAAADNEQYIAVVHKLLQQGLTNRGDLIGALLQQFPTLPPGTVGPTVDNALLTLRRQNKATKVGRGVWKAI